MKNMFSRISSLIVRKNNFKPNKIKRYSAECTQNNVTIGPIGISIAGFITGLLAVSFCGWLSGSKKMIINGREYERVIDMDYYYGTDPNKFITINGVQYVGTYGTKE